MNLSKVKKQNTAKKPIPKINIISSITIKPSTSTADTASIEDSEDENVLNSEKANVKYFEDAFMGNTSVFDGLCFLCCNKITKNNVGIRCISCKRQYHRRCLLKTHPKDVKFTCGLCTIKNNVKPTK
jgi:uncharacterized protein YcbK (DUF882 family)